VPAERDSRAFATLFGQRLEGGEKVVTGPRRVLKKLEDGDSLKPTDPEEEEKKKDSEDEEEDDSS